MKRGLLKLVGAETAVYNGAIDAINDNTNTNDIFIVGSGFGRTGTSTLQLALAKLGYKTFHMRELLKDTNKMYLFIQAAELKLKLKQEIKESKTENIKSNDIWNHMKLNKDDFKWSDIFGDDENKFHATVDFPACAFYLDIMEYYKPNYKVILSVRDNSDKWYTSISQTLLQMMALQKNHWLLRKIAAPEHKLHECVMDLIFDDPQRLGNEEKYKKIYDEWIEHVKQNVPKDKLLIFNVKEGWPSLCKFLNIDIIPNEPFPRSNESKQLIAIIKNVKIVLNVIYCVVVVVIAIILYFWIR
eukprot:46655_1